jgi:hypothetical protein
MRSGGKATVGAAKEREIRIKGWDGWSTTAWDRRFVSKAGEDVGCVTNL